MTLSHSLDAPYQPIPLGPDQADEDVEDSQPKLTTETDTLVDFKVKWIHLLLGCTVLLPWNGA
jgi:equilibrative nucleoside transporter 1/2/3